MNYTHAEVASLDPQTMRMLCEEYLANNYIDPETSERLGVKRGLRNPDGTGVLAGLTNVCDVVGYKKDQEGHVIPIPGRLIYRGVDINEIVNEAYRNDRFVFEEVIWLLLFGSLPTQEQLDDFCELLAEHRALPDGFMDTMNAPSPNIMNKMQRCVLGLYSYDEHAEDLTLENILNQSINLIASMPTMMVNAYQMKRRYYDKQSMFFHMPKPGQSTAEHILSTYRPDQKFTHEEAKLLDMCLLVHADHGGGNCSTFTARVLSSSGTDTYSAIAAAIGALKGPKHGGANLMVNRQLQDILKHVEHPEDDDEVREYLRRILRRQAGDGSGLIYGMGHAVYTMSDPREVILKERAKHLAYEKGFEEEYNMLCSIERLAPDIFAEEKGSSKPVCANVDLFSGLIYNMLGICYETGVGTEKGPAIAANLYRRAAEQGSDLARCRLGWLYERGLGVERDLRRAEELYEAGGRAGVSGAKEALDRVRAALAAPPEPQPEDKPVDKKSPLRRLLDRLKGPKSEE